MEIPQIIFLAPFLLLLLIALATSGVHIFHIVRFGTPSVMHRLLIGGYIAYAAMIIALSAWYLSPVDWSDTVGLGISIQIGN